MTSLLSVENLRVRHAERRIVDGLGFELAAGAAIALVGASGSGKTTALLAVLRLLPPAAVITGTVRFAGADLGNAANVARVRGGNVAIVFQEPASALDPLASVGAQLGAVLRFRCGLRGVALRREAARLFERVGLPPSRLGAYPHELSGGQRQRVAIAMAIAPKPQVLLADEPTAALDVTVAARIIDLLSELRRDLGLAIVLVSHDLGVVGRVAEWIHVMDAGRVVESGPTTRLLNDPGHPVTQGLVAARARPVRPVRPPATVLLAAREVTVDFRLRGAVWRRRKVLRAVDGCDLDLHAGWTLALVGESGSGKSTLGRAVLRLTPDAAAMTGTLRFDDSPLPVRPAQDFRRATGIVLQDPIAALSPRLRVGAIVGEGLRIHEPHLTAQARDARVALALETVRLDPALRTRWPHQLSGGQRQRVAIARATILRPRLLVLDEPTAALDAALATEVLALLVDLQAAHGIAYLFITHDLSIVRAVADTIAVMKDGRIIEQGPARQVLAAPRAAYTRALLAAADGLA